MTRPSLRIAYFSNFAPRKLGTGEGRLVAFARATALRGHRLTIFGGQPVHPDVAGALRSAGADWEPIARIGAEPWRSGRALARRFDVLQLNMVAPRSRVALAAVLAWPAKVLFVDRVSGAADETRAGWARRLLGRASMLRVAELAGISEYVRARAAHRFALPAHRTLVIANGVDTERFRPGATPRDDGPFRIIVVANLIREKGVDVLLQAMMTGGRDWMLDVVGDGPEEAALREMAERLGLASRVQFLGLRDDVPDRLRAADVAVHPARWREAVGNTVLEAMATGMPLVASRVGGIPELMDDGAEGLLVMPDDPRALADALGRLAADPGLRDRIGNAARARVLRDYALEASVGRHLDWCERVAGLRRW
ncbi:MAG: glycosyltransferase family 4 protein [Gemmatimonadales bacterium]